MGVLRSVLRGIALYVVVAGVLAATSPFTSVARAASELTVSAGARLTAAGAPVDLHLTGELGEAWPSTRVAVEVRGPGLPSTGGSGWPVVGHLDRRLGDLDGSIDTHVSLPASAFPQEGGYRVTVTVSSGNAQQATGAVWLGRVADLPPNIELALVWPVMAGGHRDPSGTFIDQVVQGSVAPDSQAAGSLYALFGLMDRFPAWHMTLAVEPLFLSQMKDLSDGYTEVGEEGTRIAVDKGDGAALQAAQALDVFRSAAALDAVQMIPTPYASPELGRVAQEGWADGFDQIQVGKKEMQSILQVTAVPDTVYLPGLDLTTDGLGLLAKASIDYVLTKVAVARDLAEPPEDLHRPVRVRDLENGRLTLVFADQELSAAVAPPWDAGRFAAALAALLASGVRGPFVAAPNEEYAQPPAGYLADMGDMLAGVPWVGTRTLAEVIANNPPDSRPILLSRYAGPAEGFMAQVYLESLRNAQKAAADFEQATDSDRAPLDRLRRLLMEAESRYWFVRGTDPRIVNVGLSYVKAAADLVAGEFDKIDVAGDTSMIIVGREGDVPVAVVNRAGYPLKVRITLSGEGVEFPKGIATSVTLEPQENVFSFPARFSRDSTLIDVRVAAGATVVDEAVVHVRSIAAGSVIPWVGGVVVLLAAAFMVVRRMVR